jgi:hypothetical protein
MARAGLGGALPKARNLTTVQVFQLLSEEEALEIPEFRSSTPGWRLTGAPRSTPRADLATTLLATQHVKAVVRHVVAVDVRQVGDPPYRRQAKPGRRLQGKDWRYDDDAGACEGNPSAVK